MLANSRTLASILASMAESCNSMKTLKQIHAQAICTGLHYHSVVLAKIFRFVAVSPAGDLHHAHQLFDLIPQPNHFFYNILIRGYSTSSSPALSVNVFNKMRQSAVDPDGYTFTFLIKARSRMKGSLGSITFDSDEIHGSVIKFGFSSYLHVQNGLIHLYAVKGIPFAARRVFEEAVNADVVSWSGLVLAYVKAGELEMARWVFDKMPEKDVVSWTAMVSGYSQAKRSREALDLFIEMKNAGVKPDEVTMVSVISACTDLSDIETGYNLHRYIDQNGFEWMVSLSNALIDMYRKCGCIEMAWQVFDKMSNKSLITWNSMISACANQGYAEDAFYLFIHMLNNSRVLPDGITFLALLTACVHKGWVDEGYRLFYSMQRDYDIGASIEHCGCMVDMLGRAGRLEEAYEFIANMPMPCNDVVWGALLAACRIHGDVKMGERIVEKLLELKPEEGGYYILLRDIYVAAGLTKEAYEMRQAMVKSGARKNPGFSWIGA